MNKNASIARIRLIYILTTIFLIALFIYTFTYYTELAYIPAFVVIILFSGALLILLTSYLRVNASLQHALQLQLQLQEEKIFAQTIINSSPDNLIVLDKELRYISANPSAEKIIFQLTDSYIGKKTTDLFPQSPALPDMLKTLKGESIYIKDYYSAYTDAHFEILYTPLKRGDNIIGLIARSRDITGVLKTNRQLAVQNDTLEKMNLELQQKNQEIALSKYNKLFLTEFSEKFSSAKSQHDFFSSLVQFIADLTQLDYVLIGRVEQNADNESIIQTMAVAANQQIVDNFIYPLPDGPCEQIIRGNVYSYPNQCRITFPKNQTLVQFNVEGYIGYPLYNSQGEAIGLIAVMHQQEITEVETTISMLKIVANRAEIEMDRIKYQEDLERSNKKLELQNAALEKMNKELQSFAYISSHDLQEPLRKIQTIASRIVDKEFHSLSDQAKDYFRRLQEAARRMQVLIEDLLAYSRTNTEARKFEIVDLLHVIESVRGDLEEEIILSKGVIEVKATCKANVIPFQFRQLMQNLISNALKFVRTDTPPHITISCKNIYIEEANPLNLSLHATYCHITVKDNGIGFEEQYNEKIFEVFQRLHGKEQYHGTGIGLAIVKKIVENHHGIIKASAIVNEGATFDIYLPIHQESARPVLKN